MEPTALDPRTLLMLLTVSETGSINRAAGVLNISQPALSKNLSDFEARIGAKVLDRSLSGTKLTPVGEALCQNARTIRAELARGQRQLASMSSSTAGTLTVGSSPVGESYLLPRSIELFLHDRPNFQLLVSDESASELVSALRRGKIDLLLGPLWDEEPGSELVEELLFHDRMAVVVRADHPLVKATELSLADARKMGWILPPAGLRLRGQIENAFAQANLDLPSTTVEASQYAVARSLIRSGPWLAALPIQSAAAEISDGTFAVLSLVLSIPPRPIGITFRRSEHQPPELVQFIECLKQAVSEIMVD